eukprot:11136011-Prorocentrum_lima.AAC.1
MPLAPATPVPAGKPGGEVGVEYGYPLLGIVGIEEEEAAAAACGKSRSAGGRLSSALPASG